MPKRVEIEDHAVLLGVDLPPEPVQAGQTITFRLYLRAIGQLPDNQVWQVSLIGEGVPTLPAGRQPATPWAADTIVEYDVAVQLPRDLPAGTYSLKVSLWDEVSGQELAQFPIPESAVQFQVVGP